VVRLVRVRVRVRARVRARVRVRFRVRVRVGVRVRVRVRVRVSVVARLDDDDVAARRVLRDLARRVAQRQALGVEGVAQLVEREDAQRVAWSGLGLGSGLGSGLGLGLG